MTSGGNNRRPGKNNTPLVTVTCRTGLAALGLALDRQFPDFHHAISIPPISPPRPLHFNAVMSQEYFPGGSSSRGGSSSAGEGSSRFPPAQPSDNPFLPLRPNYMTVGNGSTSRSADALMSTLNEDSGYGGSIGSPFDSDVDWRAGLMEDRPTPMYPSFPGQWNPAGW